MDTHRVNSPLENCDQTASLSFSWIPVLFGKGPRYEILSLDSRGNVIHRINTTKDFTILLDFLNFVFCISPSTHSDGRFTLMCFTSHMIRKPVIHIF